MKTRLLLVFAFAVLGTAIVALDIQLSCVQSEVEGTTAVTGDLVTALGRSTLQAAEMRRVVLGNDAGRK